MMRSILVPVVPFFIVLASACASQAPPVVEPGKGETSPCATVLCAPDSVCEVQPDGTPACVQPGGPRPCFKTGCSGTVCADAPVVTTCEYRPEYSCYQSAICERDRETGVCQFRPTAELTACLQSYR
ncbi:MAG: hypothetical protein IT372_38170 [Polyangiaceae bacterium]|nr:hypothetical protein [Polyangiaceae bacterium]